MAHLFQPNWSTYSVHMIGISTDPTSRLLSAGAHMEKHYPPFTRLSLNFTCTMKLCQVTHSKTPHSSVLQWQFSVIKQYHLGRYTGLI